MRVRVGSAPVLAMALLALMASLPGSVAAQAPEPDVTGIFDDEPPPPIRLWGTYGVGTGFVSDGGDPQDAAHLARLTIERGANSLIIHFARIGQAFGEGSDEVHEFGALYGRALNRGLFKVQGAIGLARLAGFECLDVSDPDECDAAGTFGFPASLEFTVRPTRFLGVGVHAFATVSPDGAWGGIGVVGHLGLLR